MSDDLGIKSDRTTAAPGSGGRWTTGKGIASGVFLVGMALCIRYVAGGLNAEMLASAALVLVLILAVARMVE